MQTHPALQAACALEEQGIRVVWLKPGTEQPVDADWKESAAAASDDLVMTFGQGRNLAVELGRPIGDSQRRLAVLEFRSSEEHEADMASTVAHHLPDHVRFPNFGTTDCRTFVLVVPEALDDRTIFQSENTVRRRPAWTVELRSSGLLTLPPSVLADGSTLAWNDGRSLEELLSDPFEADLLEPSNDEIRFFEEIRLPRSNKPASKSLAAARPRADLRDVRETLDALGSDWKERDQWVRVGKALHEEFHGSDQDDEALREFAEWSVPDYELEECTEVWVGYAKQSLEVLPCSLGSLYIAAGRRKPDEISAAVRAAKSLPGAIQAVAKLSLSDLQLNIAVALLQERATKEATGGQKPLGRTVILKSVREAMRKVSRQEASSDGSGGAGLEFALADHVLSSRFTWPDGDRTLVSVNGDPWAWDDGRWQPVKRPFVEAEVQRAIVALQQPLKKGQADSDLRKALKNMLFDSGRFDTLSSLSSAVATVLIRQCEVRPAADPINLRGSLTAESDESSINCKNVYLRFNDDGTCQTIPHSPSQYQHSRLSVSYDPTADCPLWKKTLNELFRHAVEPNEVIRHLQEVLGYALQSRRNLATWIYFFGPKSRNGKGVVTSTICGMLGTDSVLAVSISDFASGNDNHATASLVGKRIVVDDDVDRNCILPDGFIKRASEKKLITANPKNGQTYQFFSAAIPWLNANHHIVTRDASPAMLNRAQIFRFDSHFSDNDPRTDKNLSAKLAKEWPGILNWCIAGWQRVLSRGSRFEQPAAVRAAISEWSRSRSSSACFIDENYVLSRNPLDVISGIELYRKFELWSQESGHGRQMGRNRFYEDLSTLDGVGAPEGAPRVFTGLRPRDRLSPSNPLPKFYDDLL